MNGPDIPGMAAIRNHSEYVDDRRVSAILNGDGKGDVVWPSNQ
jgi:hypothetical protein